MSVLQVRVTVNGGSVSALAASSAHPWAAVDFSNVCENSRVESRVRERQRGRVIELDFMPGARATTPRDIVEARAVAALLASLRTQRAPL